MNTDDLMAAAKLNPLRAARLCQRELAKLDKGYHAELRSLIAVGYSAAYEIQHDPDTWLSFTQEEFWKFRTKRLGPKSIDHALLHMMVFVCSGDTDQRYDRANKYATALEPMWEKGETPEKVLEIVRQLGPEKLLRQSQKLRALQKQESDGAKDKTCDKNCAELCESVSADDDAEGKATESNRPVTNTSGTNPVTSRWAEEASDTETRQRKVNGLRLSASREVRKQAKGLVAGERARLTIKRIESKSRSFLRVVKFTKASR